jgi:hypothetical protein
MRYLILVAALFASSAAIARDVHVDGHTRQNGTYVQPHMRTAPDSSLQNNYSSQGNTNPYTGQQGTVNPYATPTYQTPTVQQPNNRGQSGICLYGQRC